MAAPCVVMGHGFAARKEGRLDAFAQRFADAGMAVLVFDHRHFGSSTGEPKGLVNTRRQHEDWQAAVAFARSLDRVDPKRIALWGWSNGGGHAIWTAARDPEIAAVVSQMPHVDGPATMRNLGPRRLALLTAAGLRDAGGSCLGRVHRIPIVGPPGSASAMASPDAESGYGAIYPDDFVWENSVPARIALTYGLYSPGRDAKRVTCPMLVIVGERDAITPPKAARATAARAPNCEILSYDCGHFDAFRGDWFERAATDELDFLRRTLQV